MTLQNRIARLHRDNQKPGILFTRYCSQCQVSMPVLGGTDKRVNGKRQFVCHLCRKNLGESHE